MDHVSMLRNLFSRLAEEGRLELPGDFFIGEYVRKPNAQGCFLHGDGWFLFRIDEHNQPQITGPFSEKGIVYACALMLHQASGLEEYRFSEEERSIYIHRHDHSPEDLTAPMR